MTRKIFRSILLAAAVAMDALLALGARRAYLQLIGQAICTEAAARQIREKQSEKERRRQAVSDLVAMQQDAQRQQERENRRNSSERRQQQGDRPERSERRERPRRDEDAYDLPPVEQSTTSLAGLFAAAMANAEKKDEE